MDPNDCCHLLVSASGAPFVPVCWPTYVCDPGCWSLGLPAEAAEPDLAHVGRPMVQLYTLHQQAVLATPPMEHVYSLPTGLVQPVVATYSMMQLSKAAGLVQPVCSMGNFYTLH